MVWKHNSEEILIGGRFWLTGMLNGSQASLTASRKQPRGVGNKRLAIKIYWRTTDDMHKAHNGTVVAHGKVKRLLRHGRRDWQGLAANAESRPDCRQRTISISHRLELIRLAVELPGRYCERRIESRRVLQ